MSLRKKVIRLAHEKPELRKHLLPLVTDKTAGISPNDTFEQLAESERKSVKFLRTLHFQLQKRISKELGAKYETAVDHRKEVILFRVRIQDLITVAIRVNRDTEMIDFDVKGDSFKIESMDWTNASMKNVIDKVLHIFFHLIGTYTPKTNKVAGRLEDYDFLGEILNLKRYAYGQNGVFIDEGKYTLRQLQLILKQNRLTHLDIEENGYRGGWHIT